MEINREEILTYHQGGKVGLGLTKELADVEALCKAYTPGVATPVKEIARDPASLYKYTAKGNLVAIVTDGTAILGLGDLGPEASIPVMEGKAALFKVFGDVDGWPVPLDCCRLGEDKKRGRTDPQEVIDAVCKIAPMYGGINLEDIAAPACFEIEERLDEMLDIPVFHDDQWGTAVITLAGLINYCLISEQKIEALKIVINGAGAAGIRIAEVIKAYGAKDVVLCDSKGVINTERADLTAKKRQHAAKTKSQTVQEAMRGANVFIGVSVANCITGEDVKAMAPYPAIFAMANPDPEIRPNEVVEALGGNPYVMATGRSNYPNQINNALAFPFLFRGALDVQAKTINMEMKMAAAQALASVACEPVPEAVQQLYIYEKNLTFGPDYLIPKPFDRRLFVEVSYAVAEAAVRSKVAPTRDLSLYREELLKRVNF